MRNARSLDPIEMTPEQLQQSLLDTQSRIEQGDRDGVLFAEGTLPASRSVAREVLGSWKPAPGTTAIPLANYNVPVLGDGSRVLQRQQEHLRVLGLCEWQEPW